MMKRPSNAPLDWTEPIHLVEDQNDSLNYHQFDYPKMTYLQEGSQEEEYLEEVEDTLEEEEAHPERDHPEEDGDLHPFKYHNHNQESW